MTKPKWHVKSVESSLRNVGFREVCVRTVASFNTCRCRCSQGKVVGDGRPSRFRSSKGDVRFERCRLGICVRVEWQKGVNTSRVPIREHSTKFVLTLTDPRTEKPSTRQRCERKTSRVQREATTVSGAHEENLREKWGTPVTLKRREIERMKRGSSG